MSSLNIAVHVVRRLASEAQALLLNIGINYRTVALPVLGAVTIPDAEAFYGLLKGIRGLRGSVILQTCNRVEFYLDAGDSSAIEEVLLRYWALETHFKQGELARLLVKKQGNAVIGHLVRLASGLESMLLGEGQILAQVKTAIAEARLHGTAGPLLPAVFEKATAAATRIRERVGMEKRSLSLGSTALRLAEEALGNLEGKNVLLIGTGQVGTLVMKALTSMNVRNAAVSGRSLKSVEAFTRILGGRPVSMREIPSYLASYDLVVIATKGSKYLLTKDTIKAALPQAGSRNLVVLDLSSHPNVSPDITELEGVTLKTLEDTRRIVDSTSGPATELLEEAEPFVKVEVESILRELRLGKSEPFMTEKSEKLMLEAATRIF